LTHLAPRRPAVVALFLSLFLVVPIVEAGPAVAAPATRTQAAAAPSSNALEVLANLLARLLPPAPAGPTPGLLSGLVGQVTASTVRVNGVACGVRVAGSGFSPAPDVIVTNAHVVAGNTTTSVLRPDGKTLPAQVQVFDPKRDLAVLSVPGLGEPSLPIGSAATGETDEIFGHPEGQAAVRVLPAVVTRRVTADIGDIYDQPGATRQILVLNATLIPGDSGSPMVNSAGRVVGVAFATSNLRRATSFAVASEELAPVLAQPRSGAVSTGPCLED
jgi:S1-C subfamily serine protease